MLALRLLQTPCLMLPDGRVHVLERKDAALLAKLAIEGPCQAPRAASLLWPDSVPAQARTNLRQRIFRLHKVAGCDVVVSAGGQLSLADGIDVDVIRFQATVPGDAHGGSGELLGSHDYGDCDDLQAWVESARQRWRDQRFERLAARASELEAADSLAAALVLAQRMVADDPLHEHGHRRLMRLHYLRGDRAAALAAYHHCRDVLRTELGTRPDRETEALVALVHDAGALPRPAPAPLPLPVATLRPPHLVGRDDVWAAMLVAWDQPTVLLLCGEAGIGKSRLLNDFATARQISLRLAAKPGDAQIPYALLARLVQRLRGVDAAWPAWVADMLGRLTAAASEPPAAAPDTLTLTRALRHVLASIAAMTIDDLHFADAATLELLPLVRPGGSRWLLASRRDTLPAGLAAWEKAATDDFVRLELRPLPQAGIEALVASLALPQLDAAATARTLARHVGGNPFYLLETLREWLASPTSERAAHAQAADGPAAQVSRRRRLVEARLAQLPPAALRLAQIAAAAGQDFSVELATQVLAQNGLAVADAWRELEDADVLHGAALAHDLLAEALLRTLPEAIGQWLHGRIAELLAARGVPHARVAAHWQAAQQWARAGTSFAQAAEQACRLSRRSEEMQALKSACACFERAGLQRQRLDMLDRAALAAFHVSDLTAVRELAELLDTQALGDADRARACAHRADIDALQTEWTAALAHADRGLALAGDDRPLCSRLVRIRACVLASLGHKAQALRDIAAVAARMHDDVPPAQRALVLCDQAHVLKACDQLRDAANVGEQAHAAALAARDWSTAELALADQSIRWLYLDELQRSIDAIERARALRRDMVEHGAGKGWSFMDDMGIGSSYADLGRFDLALDIIPPAIAGLRAGGFSSWMFAAQRDIAVIYQRLGQPERAAACLDPLPADAPAWLQLQRGLLLAALARARGQPAEPQLARVRSQRQQARGMTFMRLSVDIELARAHPRARQHLQRVAAAALAREQISLYRRAQIHLVEVLTATGHFDDAAAIARELLVHYAERLPFTVYAPETYWICHRALAAAGDMPGAADALARARRWLDAARVPDEFSRSFCERNPVNAAVYRACR